MTTPEKQSLKITLMVDWKTGPLWVTVDGEFMADYLTDEIGEYVALSRELLQAIDDRDRQFQVLYNPTVPQDSGFADADEHARFNEQGRKLAERLDAETAADVTVDYGAIGGE